ncbi:hypothetical protein [Alkalicoccus urumqiensis]|nr:hypothetical protein [Alkalicoccus urumqiensis]
MSQEKAMNKMAGRVLDGYSSVKEGEFSKARQLLEPMVPMLHREEKPNIQLLSYTAIAQIGDKDVEAFLNTCETLRPLTPQTKKEEALKQRVDDMFVELMDVLNQEERP